MNHVRALWQRRPLRIAAIVLVVVVLVFLAVPMRPTDSVSVTARYSQYVYGPSEQLFATVIHDGAKARQVREIFDAASGPFIPVGGLSADSMRTRFIPMILSSPGRVIRPNQFTGYSTTAPISRSRDGAIRSSCCIGTSRRLSTTSSCASRAYPSTPATDTSP